MRPRITFSRDESAVTIQYEAGKWRFVRPVISAWEYKAAGRVYWVMPGGDDRSAGSRAHPYKSLGKGLDTAGPGDIVICLGAGTITQWAYALPQQLADLERKRA